MTDIVERLRAYARNCGGPPEDYLTWQAADEIERLTEEVNALRLVATAHDAEVERLRAALESIARNTCCDRCQEAALVARAALEPKP
jgi:hypothetical protein